MKQHDTYNEEELYQQIMAELKPGADEYDALMAEGKAPVSKSKVVAMQERRAPLHSRITYIYKYVAAACIAFAIVVTSLGILMSNDAEMQQPVAEVVKPANNNPQSDNALLAHEEAKKPAVADSEEYADSDEHQISSALTASASTSNASDAHSNRAKADAPHPSADEAEQAFLYALITEVESRALEEQAEEERLYRSIVEEVSMNMSNNSNKPELVL